MLGGDGHLWRTEVSRLGHWDALDSGCQEGVNEGFLHGQWEVVKGHWRALEWGWAGDEQG